MSQKQLPNRSSDAGPEPTPAPSIDQLVEDARDALYEFNRTRKDDLGVERKLRREQLLQAAYATDMALEAWDSMYGPYGLVDRPSPEDDDICPQPEAQRLAMLAEAGLSLPEARAHSKGTGPAEVVFMDGSK